MRNKYENPNLVQFNSYFETNLNIPNIQTKIMGSFNMIVRVSMNKFTNFGNG